MPSGSDPDGLPATLTIGGMYSDRRPYPARHIADVDREGNQLLERSSVGREEGAECLTCHVGDDDDVELPGTVGVRRREPERVRWIRREGLDRPVAEPDRPCRHADGTWNDIGLDRPIERIEPPGGQLRRNGALAVAGAS